MGANRVFLPQEALDAWLEEERVSLEGDLMTLLEEGQRFRLESAVRFLTEVADGGDAPELVGKVKTIEQIQELGAEYVSGSVVLDDNAYETVDGFVGEPLEDLNVASGADLASATRAAVGEGRAGDSIDPLTRFFMEK